MKIAYIVPYVPNQIRTRSYNLISSLSELGQEVDVFTLGSGEADVDDAESLKAKCRAVYYQHQPVWRSVLNSVLAISSNTPLQSVYSWHPGLASRLGSILSGGSTQPAYDAVYVEHLRGSRYGLFVKSNFPSMPVVWDSVDCISYLFRQAAVQSRSLFSKLVARFELERTSKAEGSLLGRFDHVLVTSEMDKSALLDTVPRKAKAVPITVIPNGVDQDYFRVNPDLQRDADTLVFSGKMSYHANVSMVMYLYKEIMPRIWEKRPTVRLVVVGKDPPPELRKLADSSRVTVTGTVDDIRPFLWKAAAAVVPLVYGAGIQNKILEAMATGTPVITNGKVLASLSVTAGEELLIGDSADEFAVATLKLIENPVLRSTIGQAGLQYVKKHHNWSESARQIVDIFASLNRFYVSNLYDTVTS
jgi:glycosyltransferase involved in cell wall biosynthesis